ncbi:MAG: sulfite exporter TauE/SafE family protein [Devosiaceae bacterium]|nr:sulfite exporter TauE/SafE family protein [Devosiaceae bacterium MH13]
MTSLLESLTALSAEPALYYALAAVFVAGTVRGFAGFGGAMLFMPFASFLFEPRLAVVAFFIIDAITALPLVWNAFRHWDRATVLPCVLGGWAGVWFGAYLLATTDQLLLRWVICMIIVLLVGLMLSGWRYTGRPKASVSLGVGGVAGVLGGVSQVAGPPVVAYWISGPANPQVIRANLITFFFLGSLGSAAAFTANGVFTAQSTGLALWFAPFYGLGLFLGARVFKGSNETLFRRVAFGMILVAAVTSLPLLDPVLRH